MKRLNWQKNTAPLEVENLLMEYSTPYTENKKINEIKDKKRGNILVIKTVLTSDCLF